MPKTIILDPNSAGLSVAKQPRSSGAAGPTDPYWSFVKLLVTGQGTNGSSAFVDSSSIAQTITAGGSAVYSNATSKWGGTSVLISKATGDYLGLNNASDILGTGDFAVECWINLISANASAGGLFDFRTAGTAQDNITWTLQTTNDLAFFNQGSVRLSNGSALSTGVWTHIALSRTAGTTEQYVNGTRTSGTASTYSTVWNSTSQVGRIGAAYTGSANSMDGYINDFRLTVGSNRGYTGATITIPTAAMPTS